MCRMASHGYEAQRRPALFVLIFCGHGLILSRRVPDTRKGVCHKRAKENRAEQGGCRRTGVDGRDSPFMELGTTTGYKERCRRPGFGRGHLTVFVYMHMSIQPKL